MTYGWIKLHRKIQDNDLWVCEKFTRGQAWVDLLMLANHKPGYILVRGVRLDIQRGQVGWSEVALAKRWKWSRGKVQRFLNDLEKKDGQIIQQKNNISSIITISNYELYQDIITPDDTGNGQQINQHSVRRKSTNKKKKNPNNDKNNEKELGDKSLDFYNKIVLIFSQLYFETRGLDYTITNALQEKKAVQKLLEIYQNKNPNSSLDSTIESFRNYFQLCLQLNDNWHFNKMSIPYIVNNLNQLNNLIRNGKTTKQRGQGCSPQQLAKVIAKKLATNCNKL